MTAALGSPYDVSGAAHLPKSAFRVKTDGLGDIAGQGEALTMLRLEGITASAAHRAGSLRELLAPFGTATLVEDTASVALWATIRDALPFAASGALGPWPVWRIVCPPASGAALGTQLARETGGDVIYDWGGGLIWAALPPKADAHAPVVRQRTDAAGGHATLIRAAEDVRRNVDVFHPQASGIAALSERVRASFDPKTILNRGRLTRGACG
jgi:glycolate oxidase FAD binding subunit